MDVEGHIETRIIQAENTRWNKWFKRWKDAATVMDTYSRQFGFSPVSKTNIDIPIPIITSPLMK